MGNIFQHAPTAVKKKQISNTDSLPPSMAWQSGNKSKIHNIKQGLSAFCHETVLRWPSALQNMNEPVSYNSLVSGTQPP